MPTPTRTPAHATTDSVWRAIERASFMVMTWVTPAGEPRSSGVVYGTAGRHLWVAVAPESWKARQILTDQLVAATIPVRRGGLLSLLFPIPPATISFQAGVRIHPPGSTAASSLPTELLRLLPADRREAACLIELIPEGRFVTFGIGVSLNDLRSPARARAVVAVA